jgi:hypothetical protein
MKDLTPMSAEKFQEIYSDEKIRNAVAFAHSCFDKDRNFLHYKAMCWPDAFSVTKEQIGLAIVERNMAKAEKVANMGNKLVFVGMGMDYAPKYEGDPGNHRIRTEFVNSNGTRFFIELGPGTGENMRVDHAINRTLQDQLNDSHERQGEFYNWKGLERRGGGQYTKENILKMVNEEFDCKFTEMEVDNFTLTTDDFTCKSL